MSTDHDDDSSSETTDVTERAIGLGNVRGGAGLDMQVELAHRFPRSVKKFMGEAATLVTLSEDVAESCSYALPRKKKDKETGQWITVNIEGPSARFAEIVLSCWGNARAGIRPAGEDDKTVTSAGYMLDLEKNVGIEVEVGRSITDSGGRRYKQDMVTVTANAAGSIALRNAILKVVPKALWQPIYEKARATALGTEATLSNKRVSALAWFQKKGASADTIFEHFGVKGIEDITLEHIATLLGYKTALKEGDTTVESLFGKDDPAATGKPVKTSDDILQRGQTPAATPAPTPAPTPEQQRVSGIAADIAAKEAATRDQPDLLGERKQDDAPISFDDLKAKMSAARKLDTLDGWYSMRSAFKDVAQLAILDEIYNARKAQLETKQ